LGAVMLRRVSCIFGAIGLAILASNVANAAVLQPNPLTFTGIGQSYSPTQSDQNTNLFTDTANITVTGGDFLTQFDLTSTAGTWTTLELSLDGSNFFSALAVGQLPLTQVLLSSIGSYTVTIHYQCSGCTGGAKAGYQLDVKTLSAVVTPIPAAAVLFASGLGLLGIGGRWRRKTQA
jgi:hypothetical protein